MTEKDKDLINKAFELRASEWDLVSKLEEQAESDEAKKILHNREMYLYHKEEYISGLL
jgi:hypothetical protein